MSFSIIVNYILYGISGFYFGAFASRYSVLASAAVAEKYRNEGISGLLSCMPQLLFIFTAFFLFPTWFITKTTVGGFVYYAFLLYFFSRGYSIRVKK